MKKLLGILVLSLLFSSNSYTSDNDGRWRVLISCEWGSFYKNLIHCFFTEKHD
jgi:hypothetical protein